MEIKPSYQQVEDLEDGSKIKILQSTERRQKIRSKLEGGKDETKFATGHPSITLQVTSNGEHELMNVTGNLFNASVCSLVGLCVFFSILFHTLRKNPIQKQKNNNRKHFECKSQITSKPREDSILEKAVGLRMKITPTQKRGKRFNGNSG